MATAPRYKESSFPVDYRAAEVGQIMAALYRRRSIAVTGLAGMGKSNVVRFIVSHPGVRSRYLQERADDYAFLHVDCVGLVVVAEAEILGEIAVQLPGDRVADLPRNALLFLLLIPVLAGLLGGRWLGPYTAAVAALLLVVLGLVAGQAMVGNVAIGGDRGPLMAGEDMVFVTENMPLMPPQLTEDAGFVEDLREAVCEGDVETVAAWLFLMFQWWMPTCSIGIIFAFAELIPRLLVFHLIALVVLWATMANAAAWGVWWVKGPPRQTGQGRNR